MQRHHHFHHTKRIGMGFQQWQTFPISPTISQDAAVPAPQHQGDTGQSGVRLKQFLYHVDLLSPITIAALGFLHNIGTVLKTGALISLNFNSASLSTGAAWHTESFQHFLFLFHIFIICSLGFWLAMHLELRHAYLANGLRPPKLVIEFMTLALR